MPVLYAENIPDEIMTVIERYRARQIPKLSKRLTYIQILQEWIEWHRKEFEQTGILESIDSRYPEQQEHVYQ